MIIQFLARLCRRTCNQQLVYGETFSLKARNNACVRWLAALNQNHQPPAFRSLFSLAPTRFSSIIRLPHRTGN